MKKHLTVAATASVATMLALFTPALVASDFDADGDVDLGDFGILQRCFNGPNRAPAQAGCADADIDSDADVDLADFGTFQACFNGPNRSPALPDCACASGQTNCDGTCTDTQWDSANCGTCGNTCPMGLVCQNGACAPCPGGFTSCGGYCVDLDHDLLNCGSCGHACAGGEECYGGECHTAEPPCSDCGTAPDSLDRAGEADTADYAAGSITAVVPADFDGDGDVDLGDFGVLQSCFNGPNRPPAETSCFAGDFDADHDIDLADFSAFQACFNGPNRSPALPDCACASGQTNCDGTCTDTQTDSANCGACGNVCPEGTTCVNGACSEPPPCPPGLTLCGGVCTNTAFDPGNCGGCGIVCDATCSGGICQDGW